MDESRFIMGLLITKNQALDLIAMLEKDPQPFPPGFAEYLREEFNIGKEEHHAQS